MYIFITIWSKSSSSTTYANSEVSIVMNKIRNVINLYNIFRDIKAAQKALWLSWPILSLLSITTCFSGLAIYSKYYKCDPLLQKRISSTDMLMPLYVMDTMSDKPGLPGLFIAGKIFIKF